MSAEVTNEAISRLSVRAALHGLRQLPIIARAGVIVLFLLNVALLVNTAFVWLSGQAGHDWNIYVEAGNRVGTGNLFSWSGTYAWSYSPVLAYVARLIAPIGFGAWCLMHLLALLWLPSRRLAFATLILWPFWADVHSGYVMTFVLVAALSAHRLSRSGIAAYFILCLLMPRPLMLPLLVWLLWTNRESRAPFLTLVALNFVLVLAMGQLFVWARVLSGVGSAVAASSEDIGPSAIIGPWWTAVGALIAVFLTWKGRLGWASLAASPYWLPQYLLMLLLDYDGVRASVRPAAASAGPYPSQRRP
jgi:hypothetical protein